MKNIFKALLTTILLFSIVAAQAQEPSGRDETSSIQDFGLDGPAQEVASGRSGARADLTGTWVSIVTEDWRYRMVTPQIGDLAGVPINEQGKEYALNWRPEMDESNECRAYGAASIMHKPGRIKISWQDDATLKLEFDAGNQVRYLHFDPSVEAGEPSRQGHSIARWEAPRGQQVSPGITNVVPIGQQFPRTEMVSNALQVITNNLIPGYLRKNGLPYSDQVQVREYYDLITIPDGSTWLIVDIIVEDPIYLEAPWVTSMNFKKESNDSKWNPEDCFVTNPGW